MGGRKKQARKSLSSQMQARVLTPGRPSGIPVYGSIGVTDPDPGVAPFVIFEASGCVLFLCMLEMPPKAM